jgi:hypothetical protein
MSYATRSCQTVIDACAKADDTDRLRVDIVSKLPGNDRATAERKHKRIRALELLARTSMEEGHTDMQVSVTNFELIMES